MGFAQLHVLLVTRGYWFVKKSGLLDTAWGGKLYVWSYFQYKRFLEDSYRGLIRAHPEFFKGGHVLDVGANVGYTAVLFAGALDPGYKVHAFEPERANFNRLTHSIRARAVAGLVECMRAAVGAEDGAIDLWVNPWHPGDHTIATAEFRKSHGGELTESVPLVSIDSYVKSAGIESNIRFIKIDVQGFEMAVCRGMERTLAENPGAVVSLEYGPDGMAALGFRPEQLLEWFQERDYSAQTLTGGGRLESGVPRLAKGAYTDLVFRRENVDEPAQARNADAAAD